MPKNTRILMFASLVAICVAALMAAYSFTRRVDSTLEEIIAKLDTVQRAIISSPSHLNVRAFAISSQLTQLPAAYDAIVGDSIVEAAMLYPICGRPILNAGVGGATVAMAARSILPLFKSTPPKLIIIAVGVNDAKKTIANTKEKKSKTLKVIIAL